MGLGMEMVMAMDTVMIKGQKDKRLPIMVATYNLYYSIPLITNNETYGFGRGFGNDYGSSFGSGHGSGNGDGPGDGYGHGYGLGSSFGSGHVDEDGYYN